MFALVRRSLGSRPPIPPRTRDLYARFMHVIHDYPGDPAVSRTKVRAAFLRNADLAPGSPELERVHAHAEYILKEMEAVIFLKKYRTLKRRYGAEWQPELGQAGKPKD